MTSYPDCFESARATAKSSDRINLQPRQPVPRLTSMVRSTFASLATISGLPLTHAMAKCKQSLASSKILGQSQTQPLWRMASTSTSAMHYGNCTLPSKMASSSTTNQLLVLNPTHTSSWSHPSFTISFLLLSTATPLVATSASITHYTAFGSVSLGQECTNS